MMDELEFDHKIKESALRHESRIEKPLWNKDSVWNRVESGLVKKNRFVGWKAAAVILIFISTGWAFAQWNYFRQYKTEKEAELNDIRQKYDVISAQLRENVIEKQSLIDRKDRELDSLNYQFLNFKENSVKKINQPIHQEKQVNAGVAQKLKSQELLIDSLQNKINLLENEVLAAQNLIPIEAIQTKQQEPEPFQKEFTTEQRIYLINQHSTTAYPKNGKGIRFGLKVLDESQNVEYKSSHSIFNK